MILSNLSDRGHDVSTDRRANGLKTRDCLVGSFPSKQTPFIANARRKIASQEPRERRTFQRYLLSTRAAFGGGPELPSQERHEHRPDKTAVLRTALTIAVENEQTTVTHQRIDTWNMSGGLITGNKVPSQHRVQGPHGACVNEHFSMLEIL